MAQRPDELTSPELTPPNSPESADSYSAVEQPRAPRTEQERLRELEAEQIERKILEAEHLTTEVAPETPAARQVPAAPTRQIDGVTKAVEDILSEDLGTIYAGLTPEQQAVFRREGERTAGVIREMLEKVKLKTSSLLDLIRKWLRLIPGVNKFFLEQEAKIKADKVMTLHDQIHGRGHE
ncbi:MAG: hypothetical protein HY976_00980 [Candidatus Kerfeldbacteria bacterium]|nr:hypothetical protein [Candidatus Kerfeldbacteria bacterium]